MVAALKEKFADMNLTYSIGGQISFDVFPKVQLSFSSHYLCLVGAAWVTSVFQTPLLFTVPPYPPTILQCSCSAHAAHTANIRRPLLRSSFRSICKKYTVAKTCNVKTCNAFAFVQGWDKTYCLQFLTKEFDTIHFFGDKTFEVMLFASWFSTFCHNSYIWCV